MEDIKIKIEWYIYFNGFLKNIFLYHELLWNN